MLKVSADSKAIVWLHLEGICMEYQQVQRIAKDTMDYAKTIIRPGMHLMDIRRLCEEKMRELGADSF